ncbi:MAG: protein-glutamate O-methyltransferase CheR [Candidatus Riflebacteria bacterium]|nr:protein-glutamate O-methyltransferase CheR [Candidatus Riflebacteria bacterium]
MEYNSNEIEKIELELLLEAVWQRHGYDFRKYSRNSLYRRVKHFITNEKIASISDLIPRIIHEEGFLRILLNELTIQVSEIFRDPGFYSVFRKNVLPVLKTWPIIRIWSAGCAGGEEAYSLAIVLHEEGVYQRSLIYATDLNEEALKQAREGIFSVSKMREYSGNYQKSDGKGSLSDYFTVNYGSAIIDSNLRKNIVFSMHNLVSDGIFTEANVVLCRNVMIYFNSDLKNKVVDTFTESISSGGFLCLGTKENLFECTSKTRYSEFDRKYKIFRKKFE